MASELICRRQVKIKKYIENNTEKIFLKKTKKKKKKRQKGKKNKGIMEYRNNRTKNVLKNVKHKNELKSWKQTA